LVEDAVELGSEPFECLGLVVDEVADDGLDAGSGEGSGQLVADGRQSGVLGSAEERERESERLGGLFDGLVAAFADAGSGAERFEEEHAGEGGLFGECREQRSCTGREKLARAAAAACAVGGGVNGLLDQVVESVVGRKQGVLFVGEELVEGLARDAGSLGDRENCGVGVALACDDVGCGEDDASSLGGAAL
jgi:hypothetical protein